MEEPPLREGGGLVDSDGAIAALAEEVARAPRVAVDTEADSLHSYPERLCLLQLGLPRGEVLVDTLSGALLDPLLAALRGSSLVLHGADFDLRLLHRSTGLVPRRVFDTMIAARLLGALRFGLADIVSERLGAELDKGLQKANWSRRPLTARMARYARQDVRHLLPLHDILDDELRRTGRLEWLEQSCERLVAECSRPPAVDPDLGMFRLKGVERLDRRGLAVLRALVLWRDEEARAANRPPYFIVSHRELPRLAEAAVRGSGASGLGLPRKMSRSRRARLRRAVEAGLALPEEEWPERPRRRGRRPPPPEPGRLSAITARRDRRAADLGIEPTLIASRATLAELARDPSSAAELLLPWQRDLLSS